MPEKSPCEIFLDCLLAADNPEAIVDLCRRHILHGTPKLFDGNEDGFYEFRKRISERFDINFHEVFLIGSAKLGFNYRTKKPFDYESDIDVTIVSNKLYDSIMQSILQYQMELRENRKSVTERELDGYHKFLEYSALGWMRPDLLPYSFRISDLKRDWFDFFSSISYGKSEAGNYKVTAGVFKTYFHLENYLVSGLRNARTALTVEGTR